jgi:hypothetical protein
MLTCNGPNKKERVDLLTRSYPWGTVNIENPVSCFPPIAINLCINSMVAIGQHRIALTTHRYHGPLRTVPGHSARILEELLE